MLFGILAAILSNLGKSPAWRSVVLFVASIVFLAFIAHNPVVFLPLAGFLALGFACLKLIERGWAKWLPVCLAVTIFVYIWLKKYTFLPEGIFLHAPYLTLGLSYIFFRVLHLLIEAGDGAGDGNAERRVGLGAYLLYTLNFTTFVSGPIQRYDEFARDQFTTTPIALGPRTVGLQLERIIRGFFKVNVLAMVLHNMQEYALAQLTQPISPAHRLFAALQLAVVYPIFLYANFSGYIDIVIALARLMRLRLPENFNRPFSAASALEFWNQWHITLSNWLKVYVYNPLLLSLMRRLTSQAIEPFLGVFCFFVTFFLVGVWHGRTSEFLFYGVLTGAGMSINKLWQILLTRAMGRKGYRGLAGNSVYKSLGRGLNFVWFSFTLFWFWADWSQIKTIFGSLSAAQWALVSLAAWIGMTVVLAAWEWLRGALLSIKTAGGPVLTSRYARVVYATALALASVAIVSLLQQPAPDVVYKQF